MRWMLLGLLGCTPVEPDLELGAGDIAFEPLDNGDPIDVIHGPQGGFHVLGSVRVNGIDPGDPNDLQSPRNPTVTFTVTADGDNQLVDAFSSFTQGLRASPDDGWQHQMLGRFLILEITDDDELHGRTLEIGVELTDADGTVLTDALTLQARRHPANQ